MGTGAADGDDRAVDAAQQAICSPLLDNVSINGATGVLVNITGGPDMTIDEVTTINSIIQEAAGEDGEMIFGVVHEKGLEGSLRVTVIATGFGEPVEEDDPLPVEVPAATVPAAKESIVEVPSDRVVIGSRYEGPRLVEEPGASPVAEPAAEPGEEGWNDSGEESEDLEIPTFIRRQMD
ncbi:MAG: hypothetical protein MJB57_01505 [Gemmatimonadetes bacterium]|nr:hypothetical protein [Gemmatimonadota bacterium]